VNEYFSARRNLIDDHLAGIARRSVAPPALGLAVESAIVSPGKRIRGTLLIAAGEALGVQAGRLLDAACAVELIHTCSLIIDDLPALDDAEMRRGERTLHRRVGEDLAILSAVALLNESYALVARNHTLMKPRRWPLATLIERVTDAVGWDGTIGGEAVDLHSEVEKLDFATLEYIHSRKTGALFVASAAVGAMLANVKQPALEALEAYAKNLGLAFQITDDILDVTSSAESLGKDVGKDQDKLTFVKLAGIDGARELKDELIDTSLDAIASLGRGAVHLRELASVVRDRTK
jgi:geranylgeranyl diphosphate synthase, type II